MPFFAKLKSLSCLGSKVPQCNQGPNREPSPSQEKLHDSPQTPSDSLDVLPPLWPTTFPKVIPGHQPALASQGWTTITYDSPRDTLFDSSQALLQASQAFFDLPDAYKEGFKTKIGSEEGWSRVEGEKEFITLRSLGNTPDELKTAAEAYWSQAGGLLNEILGLVAQSLGLPPSALTQYSLPCTSLRSEKTATMLRLFRYEGFSGESSKIVAEANFKTH